MTPASRRAGSEYFDHPSPLTGKNRKGVIYKREPEIEHQIRQLVALPSEQLLARAAIREHTDAAYVAEESLVYLLRHHHAQENVAMVRSLWQQLLKRCAKRINGLLSTLDPEMRNEAFTDATGDILTAILDLQTSHGDFFQVRFWKAADGRAISVYDRYVRELRRASRDLRMSELAGEEGFADDEAEWSPRVSATQVGAVAKGLSPEQHAMIAVALASLPEKLRTAYVLWHRDGWQIESKDPDEPTISTLFEKTPRTIRNWLQEAERRLATWKDENA